MVVDLLVKCSKALLLFAFPMSPGTVAVLGIVETVVEFLGCNEIQLQLLFVHLPGLLRGFAKSWLGVVHISLLTEDESGVGEWRDN